MRWVDFCQEFEDPEFKKVKEYLDLPVEGAQFFSVLSHVKKYFEKMHDIIVGRRAEHVKLILMKSS